MTGIGELPGLSAFQNAPQKAQTSHFQHRRSGGSAMAVVVMKFGGTSVANVERIRNVARHVKREVDAGNKVAVVVSAMSGATNQLVAWVNEADLLHDKREYDAVVASGEQITAGLIGHRAAVHGHEGALLAGLADSDRNQYGAWFGAHLRHSGRHAQGLARCRRGGGDHRLSGHRAQCGSGWRRSGAADRIRARWRIAVALDADVCDIYTDVDGVYTTDPRIVSKAQASPQGRVRGDAGDGLLGSKVLQTRSVELAMVQPHQGACYRASSLRRPWRPLSLDNLEDYRHNRLR